MFLHKAKHLTECILLHNGIRIEQQHIFTTGFTNGNIVSSREAHILLIHYQTDPRIIRSYSFHTIIVRAIVNDKHLALDTLKGLFHTLKTLLQIVSYVIADNDDTQFHSSDAVSARQRFRLGNTNGKQSSSIMAK